MVCETVSWINSFKHTHTHTPAGVFRRNYSEVLAEKAAPTIPVQPISYADAIHFMRCMCKHYHTGIICMHIACPFSSRLFDPFSFLIFSLVIFSLLNFPLFLSLLPASWMGMRPLPHGRDNWVLPTTSHRRRPISQSQSASSVLLVDH